MFSRSNNYCEILVSRFLKNIELDLLSLSKKIESSGTIIIILFELAHFESQSLLL